jgi:hypothetical protein
MRMTMPEKIEDVTEDSLFDHAVDSTPELVKEPEPAAKTEIEKPAAESKAAPEAPVGDKEKPAVDDDAAQVPSWRLREINEEKRAAQAERDALKAENARLAFERQEFQRRMAALENPAPKAADPDPLLDPKGYTEHMERRFEERLVNERREMSLQLARRTYKEEFDQAYTTAQKYVDPALRARMQQSSDPGETLIQWFREVKVRAEVGNDPAAYRKKVREESLKDPEFRKAAMEAWRNEATTQTNGRPNVLLAPSMNGVSRSSAALRASQEDLSDDALWDSTTS